MLANADQDAQREKPSVEPTCIKCTGKHPIYRCKNFLAIQILERENFILQAKLCLRCLNMHEGCKQCKFEACQKCGGIHNNLLCQAGREGRADGIIKTKDGLVAAQNTSFGWVIYQCNVDYNSATRTTLYTSRAIEIAQSNEELHRLIEKFWEIEAIPSEKLPTPEERECERIFIETHTRDPDGRYIVQLPFNSQIGRLGASKYIAEKQWYAMERRLSKCNEFRSKYTEFIKEFITLGHLTKIENDTEGGYYTSHHAVVNSEKIRVVFNASCKTSSGVSLNECQFVGKKLQRNLSNILLKFRCYEIALTADIVKMYRQVAVHQTHRKYQKIL